MTNFTSNKNQITASGYAYDAAGNLTTSPGPGTATFNAENQIVSAGGVTYTYDGDGKRVMKSSGTIYWYGAGSDPLQETDLTGAMLYQHEYFNGMRIARWEWHPNCTTLDHYALDHLGNARFVWGCSSNGAGGWDVSTFYPFGGERPVRSSVGNTFKITGKERDSESGLDNFGARFDSSTLGRFMSPDAPNVDQDPADPQSWNLYSYVRNNPLNNTDPTGEACVSNDGGKTFHDDDSGGQSCKEAQEPQKFEVKEPTLPRLPMDLLTMLRCPACPRPPLPDFTREPVLGAPVGPIGPIGSLASETPAELSLLAKLSGILRAALKGKGNFGLGTATAAEAAQAGEAWVGDGATVASDGKTLISRDGLRQYRPPSLKPNLGKVQANFESRSVPRGQWQSNGHLDIH